MIQSESFTENEINGEYHCDKRRSLFIIGKVFDVSKNKRKIFNYSVLKIYVILSFYLR